MKKKIVRPDGSTEEVEGTAEEIVEYEKRLRGEVEETKKIKSPGLLVDVVSRQLGPTPCCSEYDLRLESNVLDRYFGTSTKTS